MLVKAVCVLQWLTATTFAIQIQSEDNQKSKESKPKEEIKKSGSTESVENMVINLVLHHANQEEDRVTFFELTKFMTQSKTYSQTFKNTANYK